MSEDTGYARRELVEEAADGRPPHPAPASAITRRRLALLESLDILIGFSVVMLVFALAATALIQFLLSVSQLRGRNLRWGLTRLLMHMDPALTREVADKISWAVVKNPLVARNPRQVGGLIQREELVQLLLGIAAGTERDPLSSAVKDDLARSLERMKLKNPGDVLRDIRNTAMELEAVRPDLAAHVRTTMAIVHEAKSEFVAGLHAWFDSSIERVSQVFQGHVRIITVVVAASLVFATQLDSIEVIDRLSMDKDLRARLVNIGIEIEKAAADSSAAAREGRADTTIAPARIPPRSALGHLQKLAESGLITLPETWRVWCLPETKSWPGLVLSMILVGLGAPFWFNTLSRLLSLRSALAVKEQSDRTSRAEQTAVPSSPPTLAAPGPGSATGARRAPGEAGDEIAQG